MLLRATTNYNVLILCLKKDALIVLLDITIYVLNYEIYNKRHVLFSLQVTYKIDF